MATAGTPDAPRSLRQRSFFDELLWVHDLLRQDLATCRRLVEGADSLPVQVLLGELRALQTERPLFQLRISCLRYCRFVHGHHGLEDAALFPTVRRADPSLGESVDRLELDHREVAALLDQVERCATQLEAGDGIGREGLRQALSDLSAKLLDHLSREEASLGPLLSTWTGWPS